MHFLDAYRPLRRLTHPKEAIRQFTPSFFSITMGTGILALMIGQFPIASGLPMYAGRILWLLNIVLFVICTIAFAARTIFFPDTLKRLLKHPAQSLFLGTIPMGLAMIVNGCVLFGLPLFGPSTLQVAYPLWIIDSILAVIVGSFVPFLMFTTQKHAVESMSALWLLPIVPAEVAAASGGLLLSHLPAAIAPGVLVASVLLWSLSVPLALGVLVLLFMRMTLHRLPPKELAISNWLTLGPLGTGALGMVLLGSNARVILAGQPMLGAAAEAVGISFGLMLWGYGTWWAIVAIFTTLHHARTEIPFNMGWWGLTFPLGSYTAATYALGRVLGAPFFIYAGAVCTVLLLILWIVVAARTAHGIWHGHIFHAPCLVDAPVMQTPLQTT